MWASVLAGGYGRGGVERVSPEATRTRDMNVNGGVGMNEGNVRFTSEGCFFCKVEKEVMGIRNSNILTWHGFCTYLEGAIVIYNFKVKIVKDGVGAGRSGI